MSIVIKKKISLDFLGEDYKGSFVLMRAISFKDAEILTAQTDALVGDGAKSLEWSKNLVKDRLISGKLKEGSEETEITKDNIFDLPLDAIVQLVQILQGDIPPNSEAA